MHHSRASIRVKKEEEEEEENGKATKWEENNRGVPPRCWGRRTLYVPCMSGWISLSGVELLATASPIEPQLIFCYKFISLIQKFSRQHILGAKNICPSKILGFHTNAFLGFSARRRSPRPFFYSCQIHLF